MIRTALVGRFQARVNELAASDVVAAAAFIEREFPRFTPEEQALLTRWFEDRGVEELRAGEEAIEKVAHGRPRVRRRRLLALGYAVYEGVRRRIAGEGSS